MRYYWNAARTVRIHKKTGVAERKYRRMEKGVQKCIVWHVVDGVTLSRLPTVGPRRVPPGERRRRAQSAL